MDQRRFTVFPNHPEAALCQILQEAQHRWLRPLEVCEILKNYRKFKLTPEPPHKPQSGSLFLFDRKALRYFRKDGHNWRKKKDGKTVREAHERLKAGSVEVLHCYYAHGEDNENFQRRSYWMLETNENIVLVHYREVKEGTRSGLRSPNSYRTDGSPSIGNSPAISGPSPKTSPLVSPRATSPNNTGRSPHISPLVSPRSASPNTSTEWLGKTHSPEHDDFESSDDTDHYRLREIESSLKNSIIGIPGGLNSNIPSSTLLNPIHEIMSSVVPMENLTVAQPPSFANQSKVVKEDYMTQNNGEYDLLEWCEAVQKGSNQKENINVQNEEKPAVPSIVASDGTVGGYMMSNGNGQFQCASDISAVTNGYSTTQVNTWPAQVNNGGLVQRDTSAEGDLSTVYTEGSLLHSYEGIFPDFQADDVKRWSDQDISEQLESSTFPSSTDSTYWASTLSEDVSVLTQQMSVPAGATPSVVQEKLFIISEYSPSSAASTSGAKVLIVGTFASTVKDPSEYKWCCMFGDVEVPAEILQSGVLKCNAPTQAPGKVPFYVTCNNRIPCSDVRDFEYRADANPSSNGVASFNKRDILFQIRLARMMSSELSTFSKFKDRNFNPTMEALVTIEEWEHLEDQLTDLSYQVKDLMEQFVQKLLKEKLQFWLQEKLVDEGKGPAVLDDNGLGVLHLGAGLGYTWIISPTLSAGVNINFRDSRGWTALHWAAHCGREAMVVALLANGADPGAKTDPTSSFPVGQTAADLASAEGHKGIAGYIAEALLTKQLKTMNINNKLNDVNSCSVNDAVEPVSERTIVQPTTFGESIEQLSLKDSLAAVRNATQAAALIHTEFRIQSFKKKQELNQYEEDEFGLSNEEAQYIIASQRPSRFGPVYYDDEISNSAAVRIQQKYRGWKGRRDFLVFRQKVVKIQAHFRGHQVRKQYKKIVWSVSIVEKAILRWRRKGKGLRGFESLKNVDEAAEMEGDDDFLKAGRKQIELGLEKALARVQSMVKSPEAREQYRRLLEGYQKTKVHLEGYDFDSLTLPEENENDLLLSTDDYTMSYM